MMIGSEVQSRHEGMVKQVDYWLTMQDKKHRFHDPFLPLQCFSQTKTLIDDLPDNDLKTQLTERFNLAYKKRLQLEENLITINLWLSNQGTATKEEIEKLISTMPECDGIKEKLQNEFIEHCQSQNPVSSSSQVSSMIQQFEGFRRKRFERTIHSETPDISIDSKLKL